MAPNIGPLDDVEQLIALATDAERDGHRMVTHLIAEWRDGSNRFTKRGESLYAATVDGVVAGVGGLNIDPYVDAPDIGRVRRLYVATDRRRLGIGSLLVNQIVADARASFRLLRLRTRNPVAAAFYLSCGFTEVTGDDACTHELVLR